ncbi:MAG: glucose-phosphate thymidylyltransferase [Thermoleophilaceae bacterium]|nr:glucose-phosphate thymidylyltransferase [Thermoleophilaceae bacterium]
MVHIAGPACPYTLPIGGRPLIRHAIRSLRDAGIDEVLVVVDPAIVEDVVMAVGDPGVALHYALSPGGEDSLVHAAREAFGPGPVLVHHSDALLPDGFTPAEDTTFTSAGRVLAHTLGSAAQQVEVEDAWVYDGTVEGVLEANSAALDRLKRGRIGADHTSASIQGRVSIHPTAVLQGAKIRGPVYIGPEAQIVETYVGPYTSIGARVKLEGVEIENSIILPGAEISFPGRRLEASMVGERAQIGRDYSLPSALRLRIGPGADIQLS